MEQWSEENCAGELPTNNPNNDEASVPVLTYRGVSYTYAPQGSQGAGPLSPIKTSDYSHELEQATFQAEVAFYDIAYPYWQFPFNVGPYNQQVIKIFPAGTYIHQSNLGIVGRPRGINDWNTPAQTPYGVPPDELG